MLAGELRGGVWHRWLYPGPQPADHLTVELGDEVERVITLAGELAADDFSGRLDFAGVPGHVGLGARVGAR